MGEAPRWLYLLPGVPSGWTENTSAILWARVLDALGTSRLAAEEADLQSCEGRGGDGAQSRTTCPSLMDGSDHLGNMVGPSPGCPRHFASRG
jgi:hypothetical protein